VFFGTATSFYCRFGTFIKTSVSRGHQKKGTPFPLGKVVPYFFLGHSKHCGYERSESGDKKLVPVPGLWYGTEENL